jgi:hypothetical protein
MRFRPHSLRARSQLEPDVRLPSRHRPSMQRQAGGAPQFAPQGILGGTTSVFARHIPQQPASVWNAQSLSVAHRPPPAAPPLPPPAPPPPCPPAPAAPSVPAAASPLPPALPPAPPVPASAGPLPPEQARVATSVVRPMRLSRRVAPSIEMLPRGIRWVGRSTSTRRRLRSPSSVLLGLPGKFRSRRRDTRTRCNRPAVWSRSAQRGTCRTS